MTDLFSSTTSLSDGKPDKDMDTELAAFIIAQKQKLQFQAQVHAFNDVCWEKCIDKPGSKLDSRTETCMKNCVDRFIDVSILITNRFAQFLEKTVNM
ncbi:translocase of inner membrane 8 [Ptiloglossa arizonensis]|uniref:translocase of inner membrane 8 n=1 Tax=Ptiloglossa arizonensis TaxID=3350558 RepID=UPI003F9EE07E